MPSNTARDRITQPPIVGICASPRRARVRQRSLSRPGVADISLHVSRV